MEATTLSATEPYDYDKWSSVGFIPHSDQDDFSTVTRSLQPSAQAWVQSATDDSSFPSSDAHFGAAWMSGRGETSEKSTNLSYQPFYSDSTWGSPSNPKGSDQPRTEARQQTNRSSSRGNNIWASPFKPDSDMDTLLSNWDQQTRLEDSPPQQYQQRGPGVVLSQTRSSSTESSPHTFQNGAYHNSSPPQNGGYPGKTMGVFTHGSTSNSAYFSPGTPTSVPELYGASSGSTNTSNTNSFAWQQQVPQSGKFKPPVMPPGFMRSQSAPVDFNVDLPSLPSSKNDFTSSLPGRGNTPTSLRSATLIDSSSLHSHRDTYDSDNRRQQQQQPQQQQQHAQPRRGSRGGGGGGRGLKQERHQQSRLSPFQGNTKTRETANFKANSSISQSSLGAAASLLASDQESDAMISSEAIRQLMKPSGSSTAGSSLNKSWSTLQPSVLTEQSSFGRSGQQKGNLGGLDGSYNLSDQYSILPVQQPPPMDDLSSFLFDDITQSQSEEEETFFLTHGLNESGAEIEGVRSFDADRSRSNNQFPSSPFSKKQEWLLRMNRRLQETAVGELDPATLPLSAIFDGWAKTKSAQGARFVEMWLKRVLEEYDAGNSRVVPTTKMYTMAVDAWARSGEGADAARRAEALLQQMYELYQSGKHESLRPTTAIFNGVINSWARSKDKAAPERADQILNWMQSLKDLDVQPDKYTFNTVIHTFARAGSGIEKAAKAQELLQRMHKLYHEGNVLVKPDTITYNVCINAYAKAGCADEAEALLHEMHQLHELGDPDVKPNVVTYGAVVDSFTRSGKPEAWQRADTLLAKMIQLYQSDPIQNAGLMPNTYIFNTTINTLVKSNQRDAAQKAEEMLVAMSRLHASGIQSVKPDAFTYTAVIDSYARSNLRGASTRAHQLLEKMEAKYLAGDSDLKPNTFTYNGVICALAKSNEPGAANSAMRVLQNMVDRHRNGDGDDVKPTTINFNSVLDAVAKSGGGRQAAERAEEILEWMDRLHKGGDLEVKPDTITFNALLDAWARSADMYAPHRAEQIVDHMDALYRAGNKGVKPDTYTYNTLINAHAKASSGSLGAARRAEQILQIMDKRYHDGDPDVKPNTRTRTSVIDAWAKSSERGAARRAEHILNDMIARYEATGDPDLKPNVHTANAVCNACAFSKNEEDRTEALQIAFRVYDWLSNQSDMEADSYTYTILLSVCANLIPREDGMSRFAHARAFFESCRDAGYVNDYVLRKLKQTVTEDEYLGLVDYRTDPSAACMPHSWTRNVKLDVRAKGRRGSNNSTHTSNNNNNTSWSNRRRGKY